MVELGETRLSVSTLLNFTLRCIDRVPYFSQLTRNTFSHLMQIWQIWQVFIFLRHPVTISVTDFSNPIKLTNDLFIAWYLHFHLLHQPKVLYFNFKGTYSEQNRLTSLNPLVGPIVTRPPSCTKPQQPTMYNSNFVPQLHVQRQHQCQQDSSPVRQSEHVHLSSRIGQPHHVRVQEGPTQSGFSAILQEGICKLKFLKSLNF